MFMNVECLGVRIRVRGVGRRVGFLEEEVFELGFDEMLGFIYVRIRGKSF